MADIRIRNNEGSAILIAGPSGSGKTFRTMQFITYKDDVFTNPACMQRVLFYYNVETELFKRFKHYENIEWINRYPSDLDYINEVADQFKAIGGCTIIIDDFASQLTPEIERLFTVLSHHKRITVFLLVQNLFFGSKAWQRGISLNCQHTLIFPNYRDRNQFNQFAKQLEPGNGKYLIEAFNDICKKGDYSYMWVDSEPGSKNRLLRIRSNIFPDEWPPLTYVPRESGLER